MTGDKKKKTVEWHVLRKMMMILSKLGIYLQIIVATLVKCLSAKKSNGYTFQNNRNINSFCLKSIAHSALIDMLNSLNISIKER